MGAAYLVRILRKYGKLLFSVCQGTDSGQGVFLRQEAGGFPERKILTIRKIIGPVDNPRKAGYICRGKRMFVFIKTTCEEPLCRRRKFEFITPYMNQ